MSFTFFPLHIQFLNSTPLLSFKKMWLPAIFSITMLLFLEKYYCFKAQNASFNSSGWFHFFACRGYCTRYLTEYISQLLQNLEFKFLATGLSEHNSCISPLTISLPLISIFFLIFFSIYNQQNI